MGDFEVAIGGGFWVAVRALIFTMLRFPFLQFLRLPTLSFSSLPHLKNGSFLDFTLRISPVFGFLPSYTSYFLILKDNTYGKAIRTFYTHDQASKKPLFEKVAYTGDTVTVISVPAGLWATTVGLGKSW